MAADLTGNKIKDTYKQLLHVDGGVTTVDKFVYDGDGTAVGLKVSTTGVDVASLKISGDQIDVNSLEINQLDGVTSNIQTQLNGKASINDTAFTGTTTFETVDITGGTIDGTTVGAATPSTGAFTDLSYTGTLTGSTGVINIGSGQVYKDASGDVGIGTSSPTAKLDVRTAAGTAAQVNIYTGSNAAASTLQFGQIGAIAWNAGITAGTGNFQIGVSDGGQLGYNITRTGASIDYHSWFTAGTERLRITSAGNVGIGTSSPTVKFELAGTQLITGGSYDALTIKNSSTNATGLRIQNTSASARNYNIFSSGGGPAPVGSFGIYDDTAGATRMVIDSTGNVGINTYSPAYKLDVNGVTRSSGTFSPANSNWTNAAFRAQGSYGGGLALVDGSAGYGIWAQEAGATLVFGQGSTGGGLAERMRITGLGNVGIGTSAPAQFVQINKDTAGGTTSLLVSNPNGVGGASAALKLGVSPEDNTVAKFAIIHERFASYGRGDTYFCSNYTADTTEVTDADAVITIKGYDKFVGIGTSSPSAKLQVNGLVDGAQIICTGAQSTTEQTLLLRNSYYANNSTAGVAAIGWIDSGTSGGLLTFKTGTNGGGTTNIPTERMRIDSNGNVGIGTSSPTGKLDVVGGRSFFSANSENFALGVKYHASGGAMYFGATSASGTPDGGIFNSGGSQIISFNNNLNVGIGTSSPAYKLDVSGTGRFTGSASILTGATTTAGLIVGGDANPANTWTIARDNVTTGDLKFIGNTTERMRIDSSGNVGINTTAMTQKFNISGAGYSSGSHGWYVGDGSAFTPSGLNSIPNYGMGFISTGASTVLSSFGNMSFYVAQAVRATIDQSGNLLVGKTTTSETTNGVNIRNDGTVYAVSSSDAAILYRKTATAGFGVLLTKSDVGGTNSLVGAGFANGTFGTISDINKKKNIEDARGYLGDLMQIRVVKYNWITDEDNTPRELGWIAQEVEQVFPGMVTEIEGSKLLKKEVFVPMLVKAIQELSAKVDTLQAELNILKGN